MLLGLSLACFLAWASVPQDSSARRLAALRDDVLPARVDRSERGRPPRRRRRRATRLAAGAAHLSRSVDRRRLPRRRAARATHDRRRARARSSRRPRSSPPSSASRCKTRSAISSRAWRSRCSVRSTSGDWIELDNGQQAGRVTEVTWRATTVMTLDHVEVILPNAGLAKASIRNYSRPVTGRAAAGRRRGLTRRRSRTRCTRRSWRPRARRAGCARVARAVGPHARVRGELHRIRGAVLHRRLRPGASTSKAPFATGSTTRSSARHRDARSRRARCSCRPVDPKARREDEQRRAASAIYAAGLMGPLPDDARLVLAQSAKLTTVRPRRSASFARETRAPSSSSSSAGPWPSSSFAKTASREIAQLGPGECFGEMGLLTGEVRAATVRAKTRCDLVVVERGAFHAVLAAHPEVVERLGGLLATRQAGITAAEAAAGARQVPEERSRRLISQIREFFKLV